MDMSIDSWTEEKFEVEVTSDRKTGQQHKTKKERTTCH